MFSVKVSEAQLAKCQAEAKQSDPSRPGTGSPSAFSTPSVRSDPPAPPAPHRTAHPRSIRNAALRHAALRRARVRRVVRARRRRLARPARRGSRRDQGARLDARGYGEGRRSFGA